ncbi:MAG: transglutaminase domain-containing protein [Isosphaeraceae bacterium]
MLYRIQHETKLSYTASVFETVFEVRMAPPSDDDQTSLSYRLKTTPQAPVTSYRDGFGNRVDLFNVTTHYRELVVQTTSFVRTHRRPVLDRLAAGRAEWSGDREARVTESIEALEYLQPSPLIPRCPELDEFVNGLSIEPGPLARVLRDLMDAVAARMTYEKAVTRTKTDVGEALRLGRGVCQDYTQVFIGACRGLGLPARYVSGYVNHPGEIATHAWCQVWGGDSVGWVDVDPTHREIVGDDHISTAFGRDYHDVPPNRGLWKGRAEETINVSVKVEPIDRVPLEWNDWTTPAFRPNSQGSHQRQGGFASTRGTVKPRPAYPNQRGLRSGHVNQQSEQQQQGSGA